MFIRKRTDETHRVILIITIECLLAVLNSWFIDLILSIKFCAGSVAIGDDCPQFLRRFHQYLVLFDLLNSMSNLFLYGFAGKRFRSELKHLIRWSFSQMKNPFNRLTRVRKWNEQRRQTEEEDLFISIEASKPSRRSTLNVKQIFETFKMKSMASPTRSSDLQ